MALATVTALATLADRKDADGSHGPGFDAAGGLQHEDHRSAITSLAAGRPVMNDVAIAAMTAPAAHAQKREGCWPAIVLDIVESIGDPQRKPAAASPAT
ncbi:hypothetical protein ADZ37_08915 [Pannonibacter phragmitetus]|nr:hypothetical protein ADZ37_08915 [Pannonibacter phragmitetus]